MGLTEDHLTPSSATLVCFSGETTKSLETIKLPMTTGKALKQVTTLADFVVLDKTPNYNAILGRGALNEIKFAVSTYHLVMRFQTPHNIGEVRGNYFEEISCHFVAIKEVRYVQVLAVESEPPQLQTTLPQKI